MAWQFARVGFPLRVCSDVRLPHATSKSAPLPLIWRAEESLLPSTTSSATTVWSARIFPGISWKRGGTVPSCRRGAGAATAARRWRTPQRRSSASANCPVLRTSADCGRYASGRSAGLPRSAGADLGRLSEAASSPVEGAQPGGRARSQIAGHLGRSLISVSPRLKHMLVF